MSDQASPQLLPQVHTDHGRILALDGMRGFAVLWVMVYHFLAGASHHNWLLGSIFTFAHYGHWGVDVFFVLSGFLITGILYDSRAADNYFRAFYARRALRILPLYYFVLIGVFVVWPLVIHYTAAEAAVARHQVWMWFYVGNIAMVVKNAPLYDGGRIKLLHFWSLAIEEQFYLLWPAVVLIFERRRQMYFCIALIFTAICSRIVIDNLGISPRIGALFTLSRVDGLAIGAIIALLARGPGGICRLVSPSRWMILVTGIILAIALYAQSHQPANAELTLTGSSLRQIISLDRLGVFAGFLVLAVGGSATGLVRRGFSMQWLRFFGKYSYALYVFHYMLLPAFNRYLPMHKMSDLFHSFVIGAFVRTILCIGVSLIVALLSWNLLEKHFLKLKHLFVPSKQSPARVEPPVDLLAATNNAEAG